MHVYTQIRLNSSEWLGKPRLAAFAGLWLIASLLSASIVSASTINGSEGDDVIQGGDDGAVIDAGNGNNVVYGGAGNDSIKSGSGRDYIYAGSGNDVVRAGGEKNSIIGGDGDDLLIGGQGDDSIASGAGDDTIFPLNGSNIINSGTGLDTIRLSYGGTDQVILEAGDGFVTVAGFNPAVDRIKLGASLLGKALEYSQEGRTQVISVSGDILAKFTTTPATSPILLTNAVPKYQPISLGSLSTNVNGAIVAASINDLGHIAGRYDTGETFTNQNATTGATQTVNVRQGFIWNNGTQTALTSTGVKTGQSDFGASNGATVTLLTPTVNTISNLGIILGTADEVRQPVPIATDRALLWQKSGSAYTLSINDFGGLESYFFDINLKNQIAGRNILSSGYEKTIYSQDGVITELTALGGDGGTARGINNNGQIVGFIDSDGLLNETFLNTAVLWEKDPQGAYQLKDLGTFGAQQATLRDINDSGQIIGVRSNGSGATATSTPFLLQGQTLTLLGSLGGKTGSSNGVNEFGHVVGASQIAASTNRAYLWQNGVMSDLNDLVTTALTYNGAAVTLTNAVSINNFGDIAATGTYSYLDATGATQTGTRSYLLKAVGSQ
jgi:probable HAF family extracellular repeat protein